MGILSDYLEEKLLKHVSGIAAFTGPSTYLALSTANPGETGSGAAEPSGGSYARQQVTSGNWSWNAGSQRIENSATVTFPTASGSWGTITHWAIYDASSAGNLLAYGTVATAKTIGIGDTASLAAADLNLSLD